MWWRGDRGRTDTHSWGPCSDQAAHGEGVSQGEVLSGWVTSSPPWVSSTGSPPGPTQAQGASSTYFLEPLHLQGPYPAISPVKWSTPTTMPQTCPRILRKLPRALCAGEHRAEAAVTCSTTGPSGPAMPLAHGTYDTSPKLEDWLFQQTNLPFPLLTGAYLQTGPQFTDSLHWVHTQDYWPDAMVNAIGCILCLQTTLLWSCNQGHHPSTGRHGLEHTSFLNTRHPHGQARCLITQGIHISVFGYGITFCATNSLENGWTTSN